MSGPVEWITLAAAMVVLFRGMWAYRDNRDEAPAVALWALSAAAMAGLLIINLGMGQ